MNHQSASRGDSLAHDHGSSVPSRKSAAMRASAERSALPRTAKEPPTDGRSQLVVPPPLPFHEGRSTCLARHEVWIVDELEHAIALALGPVSRGATEMACGGHPPPRGRWST